MIPKLLHNKRNVIFLIVTALVVIISVSLGFHNATLYNPKHGFDGVGHVFYIQYVYKHKALPPADLDWETHQSPLYYIVGAVVMAANGNWKTAQYLNTFILWMCIAVVAIGLWKIFKNKEQVFVGVLSLAALPMLNIFPPMVTNELFSTFWILSFSVVALFFVHEKNQKKLPLYTVLMAGTFILGIWTKVSMIMMVPTLFIVYLYLFLSKHFQKKWILISFLIVVISIVIFSAPVFMRTSGAKGPSNIARTLSQKVANRDPYFYYRLDWIPKVDMYTTQYYSMLGGGWNSFWNDGQNAVTPFIKFHKKALILWCLGFILLPLTLYGQIRLYKKDKRSALVVNMVGITTTLFFVYYVVTNNHYSAVRLTYEMGIVFPYAAGLAYAAKHTKIKYLLYGLLSLQFIVMVSFFWIQKWWFVTQ
jgi:hypothetical protein